MDNTLYVVMMLVIGLFLIVKGGDFFVSSSTSLARICHVREMIIGATIVSVGTTIPEFLTSTISAVKGVEMGLDASYFTLGLSNAIGSMLANSGLILALVLIARPPHYDKTTFRRSGIYVCLVSLLIAVFMMTDKCISLIEGIVLLVLFVCYMTGNILEAMRGDDGRARVIQEPHEPLWKILLFFLVGAVGIGVGAMLLVDNARLLAIKMGISTEIVGVTVVAIGTSLPELVTALTALKKGNTDIGVGNILGAHMINATLIVGLVAVISMGKMEVDAVTRTLSIWTLIVIMLTLVVPATLRGKFTRSQGVFMLFCYLAYMGCNIYFAL